VKEPSSSESSSRRFWRRRKALLVTVMIIAIVGALAIFYGWEYRPQTLIDETVSIKEEYVRQISVDLSFGDRNAQITVETYTIPVYATLWWQSGTNALLYFQNQPVAVNSTWTTTVTLHNSGGEYSFLVAKSEAFGEGLTAIHVRITV